MKDRIIEAYLKDFTHEFNLVHLPYTEAFEHFVNYCIVSKEHPHPFDFEDVSVGSSGESIDGIAILVNEHLVLSKEAIDYFKTNLHRLDARFIFIETKTSDKFDMGDIGNFLFAVQSFFINRPPKGTEVNNLRDLKEHIYDSSIDMDTKPTCVIYYVTTGIWNDDNNLTKRINKEVEVLRQTDLFSDIRFIPVDADKIRSIYRELKHRVVKEITFDKHTIVPQIDNVQESYIGILPCSEYLKLISDDEGDLQRTLFYDNVRDFQGHNPVNREIEETVKDTIQNDRFALLNNGITIVAKSINKVGTSFKLKDYQIVNGCQTSHILHRNRELLTDKVYVPIKLIVTSDMEITNSIIKATNRQTEVKLEAFESLTPFQKKLEEFYSAAEKEVEKRLYYERRSKQYEVMGIRKQQIISLAAQVNSFISMFLNEPHSTHRYYGELLKSNKNRIFLEGHSPMPYYLSAYSLHVVEKFLNEGKIERFFKKFKYHMLMLFRLESESFQLPYMNSKKIDNYCSYILRLLQDEMKILSVFRHVATLIQGALDTGSYNAQEATRLRAFTSEIISRYKTSQEIVSAADKRERGKIKWFSNIRGFGFIDAGLKEEIFMHCTAIRGSEYRYMLPGEIVEFTVIASKKGLMAQDIVVLKPDSIDH